MPVSVQKFREMVFQLLYSQGFGEGDGGGLIALLMRQHAVSRKTAWGVAAEVAEVLKCSAVCDREIERHSRDFPLSKIGMVERALLRQGVAGLLEGRVPPRVVIAEAVRLAKKFSTKESGAFVNALLDAVYKERESGAVSEMATPV